MTSSFKSCMNWTNVFSKILIQRGVFLYRIPGTVFKCLIFFLYFSGQWDNQWFIKTFERITDNLRYITGLFIIQWKYFKITHLVLLHTIIAKNRCNCEFLITSI